MKTFVAVIQRGSFAAVARDQNLDPSSVSRTISGLEKQLGIRLFHRSTRQLTPTEAGLIYFQQVEPLLGELDRARLLATDSSARPTGQLRITAPVTLGQMSLVPLLPELSAQYPDLSFEVLLTDSVIDLLAERIDVAIRLGPLADSAFIASRLAVMESVVCAAPSYLARYDRPETPYDLTTHNCVLLPLPGYGTRWRFKDATGKVMEVPVMGNCRISNSLALKQCALAGMGLVLLSRWVVWHELENGSLIDIFPDYEVTATEFDTAAWILYPSKHYLPLKVRVFVDFFTQRFRQGPNWFSPLI